MRINTLILILLLSFTKIVAQEYLFDAQNITTEDGLSNLMTSAISRDQQGFLWIGTQYGLNKYDGHNFQQYTAENNGLFSNRYIQKIEEDAAGNLWLFHSYSLKTDTFISAIDIFNPISQKAVPFNQFFKEEKTFKASEMTILSVSDPKKRIWLTNKNGQIFLYQKTGLKKIVEKKGLIFTSLTIDLEGNLWLSAEKQLFCMDTLGNVLESLELPEVIQNVSLGEKNKLWVVTAKGINESKYISIWSKPKEKNRFQKLTLSKNGATVIHGQQAVRASNGFWYVVINGHEI